MIRDPEVVWESDDPGAVYLVYQHKTCYAVHIILDFFPFDDLALAMEMLSPFATISGIDNEIIFVVDLMDEDELQSLTEETTCVIIELAKYQDTWLTMTPIERLELYGKVLEDGNLE